MNALTANALTAKSRFILALRRTTFLLMSIVFVQVTQAEDCGFTFINTSLSPQSVPDCSCEDYFTVDFSFKSTCSDCYNGPRSVSGVYRRNADGSIPFLVSTNFVVECDCEGCDVQHQVTCTVRLVSDPFCKVDSPRPGSSEEGQSKGSGGGARTYRLQGSSCVIPKGAPTLAFSLGRSSSGGFTGHFLLDPARIFNFSTVTPNILTVEGDSTTGLDIITSEGEEGYCQQVRSAETFADIAISPASNSFSIAFYNPSSVCPEYTIEGHYALYPNAEPFVVYEIGPFIENADKRILPVVERRGGEIVQSRAFYTSLQSVDAGLSLSGGLVERGVRRLSNDVLFHYSRGVNTPEYGVLNYYTIVLGESVLSKRIETSSNEIRTNIWEYASLSSLPSAHIDPSGLRTEWEYDGAGRIIRETVHAPGRPVHVTTKSYDSLKVLPHEVDGDGLNIDEDDGSEFVDLARDEREYLDGIMVSRTLRFASSDIRKHRIVEEVRLKDNLHENASNAWENPLHLRTYTNYMPKDSCRACSERVFLSVAEDGVIDERDYVSGTYIPGPNGTAGVFTPDPLNKEYFRTVITRRPPAAFSGGPAQIPGRTLREVTIEVRSSRLVVLKETYVCTGLNEDDFERISWTSINRDSLGNPVLEVASDGSRIEREYAGTRLVREIAQDGSSISYIYDALGNISSEVKSWNGLRPEMTTSYTRDIEGRVLSRTVTSGSLSQTETKEYDAFGRTTLAVATDGVATKYIYTTDATVGLETRTTINGFGTQCASTNTTVSYADGRTKETRFNNQLKSTYLYGVDNNGCEWSKTFEGSKGELSPRWSQRKINPLGQTIEEIRPTFGNSILATSNIYSPAGRLISSKTIDSQSNLLLNSTIYSYNEYGENNLTVEDINRNGVIDFSNSDRIVSNDTEYVKLDGDWWRKTSSWQTRENNSSSYTCVGTKLERLTGLGVDNLASETKSIDAYGNATLSFVYRDRSLLKVTQFTHLPNSILDAQSISIAGLVVSNLSATDIAFSYAYDALGRQIASTDGRGNTTTTVYDQYGRVASTIDAAGNATVYGYDAIGRRVSSIDPVGNIVTTAYDAEGRVLSQRGATYPLDYSYDEYGNKVSMTTYRDLNSSGDTTKWFYDEATGLVTNKVYADGKGPAYTYAPDGKLATRTWARGVVTSYTYDNTGSLIKTEYSDGTPTISMTYDRVGNMISAITDGVCTNFYAYDKRGLCTNEIQNGVAIIRNYDMLGRAIGYTLQDKDISQNVSYQYDFVGRFESVMSSTNKFVYSYLAGTDIVDGYTCGNFKRKISYEPLRNLISSITNSFGSRIVSVFDYTNDAAGRRTAISRSGEAFGDLSGATDSYGYNSRNEVISARRTKNGEIIHGFNEDFEYDPIGNRIWSTTYNELGEPKTSQYIANNLNQYTSRTVPGYAAVRGHADADATVTVNENATYRYGEYFFGSDEFDNSSARCFAELDVFATISDGTCDFVSVVTNRVFVPPANETYLYDADGNVTEDARFRYYWNGENRMVRAEEKSAPPGRQPYDIDYAYDHMGRNVIKDGYKLIWDDYNIIVEDATSSNATFNIWGLDLDGTMQGTGGVGGLLAVKNGDTVYLPVYDANGNILEYVDTDGVIVAHYTYSSFGKLLMENDNICFTHRFSTKPYCPETLFVEYEFRKYAPNVGRWCNRDIIEVVPLYCMVYNRLVLEVDLLGAASASLPSSYYNKYTNPTEAVRRRGQYINPRSKQEHREYCGCVCKKKNPETCKYEYFTTQVRGSLDKCDPRDAPCPSDSIWVAWWHSHGGNDPGYMNEDFSPNDIGFSDGYNIDGYLITP